MSFQADHAMEPMIARILESSPSPVLLVPPDQPLAFEKTLVAYNRSRPATRALRGFIRISHLMDDGDSSPFSGDRSPITATSHVDTAFNYLQSYRCNRIDTQITSRDLAISIRENHVEEVDIIVAGTHTKSLATDCMIGSFTQEMIRSGQTALLLSN
ncbi:MAG: hypothetical protein AAF514_05385 [Verrucomicrobiota bacterium]